VNRNLQRVLVGLVSFSILAAPFVSGAALANICGAQDGHWRIARVPAFKQGSGTFVDYEVDRSSPNRIMVTNGTVVMLSTDSACSWKQVFALPDQANSESGSTAANSLIKTIDISEIKRDRVLLMVEEQTPLGVRPHVVRSDDMGGTWASGDVGLPPQGAPEELVLPPSSPDLAYLAIDIGGGSIDLLFASTDGGLTWVARSNPTAITQQMAITDFTVDPLDAQSLWAWGTNGLYHSTDGGATYNAVQDFIGRQVTTTDVYHGDGDARIAGFLAENQVIFSTNGGQTWLSQASPPSANSSAHGDGPADAFITAGGEPYAYNNVVKGWTNLGAPRDNLSDATTDKADVVYFRTAHEILSYSGPPPAPGTSPDDVFQGGYIDPPRQVQEHDPILTPARRRIALDPGETKTVKYDLALSKTPLPVNVFFLLDTSDSMGATIDDLAASVIDIYNLLNEQNFKLKIGVGAFRAFPDHFPPRPNCDGQSVPGQTCETNYVFKNFYDIAPASATVRDVLDNLESDAGGFYKSHLQALYTLATGERVDLFPAGPDDGDVPAGEGATFDDEAYRVVIHATDEAFWKGEARDGGSTDFGNPTPPETPLFDDVDEALGAKEIYQVGLSIGPAPRHDLERVAELTDALAPAGGVDCGKNHFLAEGDPLVCPVSRNNLTYSTNLVPAIVNLIENLPTGVNVDYQVKGDERIVKKVTPENKSDVVLQVANDLDFEVTYHCPADLSGKSFDIKLNALNEGEPGSAEAAQLLADGTTEIVCRETPKDNPVIPPIVAVSLVSLAIPPPPPPPPAQLTSASQAQSQAQAQTGAVFEEEKEPQLAIAAAYREAMQEENDYAYEMVAYEGRKEPVSPYLTLGAGAVMTAMAAAGMMIHRTRQSRRLALQYNRRSRR
jgi:hypothetical protein